MYYSFELCAFPVITKYYTVTRNTVWGVTTTENLMIILKEGRCIFSVDGEEFEAKSGDAVFIPANHIYERKSVNGELCTMTYIHFLLEKEAEMLDSVTVSQRLSATKKQLDNSFCFAERLYLLSSHRLFAKSHYRNRYKKDRYVHGRHKSVFRFKRNNLLFTIEYSTLFNTYSFIAKHSFGVQGQLHRCRNIGYSGKSQKSNRIHPKQLFKADYS